LRTVPLDFASAFGALLRFDPASGDEATVVGLLLGGELTLDEASRSDGAPITGRIDGTLVESIW
jgi:hypothetical protein